MSKSQTKCLLYANCIPVKGAKNSIICDLQRQNYVQIPDGLYEILTDHKGKSLEEIKSVYDNEYDDIIESYFEVLIENEFAFFTNTPELFPEISMEWDEPLEITNTIIDIDEGSDFDIFSILDQLSDIHCKFIQIRFYHKINLDRIKSILEYLDQVQSNSIGIDFLFPYVKEKEENEFINLFTTFKRLNTVAVYDSPIKKLINIGHSKYLIFSGQKIDSENCCGIIEKETFSVHLKTFTESQKYNSCLNRKISIDKTGHIRNCPSMPKSFGKIDQVTLKEALNHASFKDFWKINKDQIDICKDCEFRYICTDCRAYTTDPSIKTSKPLKCGYNPYSGLWEPWSQNELKNIARK